jgi:DNA-binding transcriptional regulator YiaG
MLHAVTMRSTIADGLTTAVRRARAVRELPPPDERRRIRVRAGVSLSVVADAVGVTRAAVARWEAGQRSPSGDLVFAYAAALDRLKAAG